MPFLSTNLATSMWYDSLSLTFSIIMRTFAVYASFLYDNMPKLGSVELQL